MKNQINNTVTITGNLGNQPEIKELTSGLLCAKFNVATRTFSKDENGHWVKNTHWHKVIAWGKTAELVKASLGKGRCANIEGVRKQRRYTDKQGNDKSYIEIVAEKILVFPKRVRHAIS